MFATAQDIHSLVEELEQAHEQRSTRLKALRNDTKQALLHYQRTRRKSTIALSRKLIQDMSRRHTAVVRTLTGFRRGRMTAAKKYHKDMRMFREGLRRANGNEMAALRADRLGWSIPMREDLKNRQHRLNHDVHAFLREVRQKREHQSETQQQNLQEYHTTLQSSVKGMLNAFQAARALVHAEQEQGHAIWQNYVMRRQAQHKQETLESAKSLKSKASTPSASKPALAKTAAKQ